MDKAIKIVGFTGSLRKNSFNKAALRAAQGLLPEGAELEILDVSALPFFNEDLEAQGVPPVVEEFKRKLSEADAVLISTPEYNYSIPPVLKNALDWASREPFLPLSGKPGAILSASTGMFGGARAQYHLRQVCVSLNLLVLAQPQTFIPKAQEKFDEQGNLTYERSRKSIERLLKALVKEAKFRRMAKEQPEAQ